MTNIVIFVTAIMVVGVQSHRYVRVTVENLAPSGGTGISSIFVGLHDGRGFDIFDAGSRASSALEMKAEDGLNDLLLEQWTEARQRSSYWASVGMMGVGPGMSATELIQVDHNSRKSRYFSFCAMVGPSNDAFIGNDNPREYKVFADEDFEDLVIEITGSAIWDAGTEMNDERPENIKALGGTQGAGERDNDVVRIHPGFKPSGSGGIVDLSTYGNADFKARGYIQARITVAWVEFVTVEVENTAPSSGTWLTPMWVGFHDGSFSYFEEGRRAESWVERMAEDGNLQELADYFSSECDECAQGIVGTSPYQPGNSASVEFELPAPTRIAKYFSYAAMVLPSNDAFIGSEATSHAIYANTNDFGSLLIQVTSRNVYDAGTEVNDEFPDHVPLLNQTTPDTGEDENGRISMHGGYQQAGRGGVLDVGQYRNADFTSSGYNVC